MRNICLLLLALFVFTNVWTNKQIKDSRNEIQELKYLIEKRTYLDSCYWDHLEDCSFIRKDSIGVGYQGYLYDKYSRVYKLQN